MPAKHADLQNILLPSKKFRTYGLRFLQIFFLLIGALYGSVDAYVRRVGYITNCKKIHRRLLPLLPLTGLFEAIEETSGSESLADEVGNSCKKEYRKKKETAAW